MSRFSRPPPIAHPCTSRSGEHHSATRTALCAGRWVGGWCRRPPSTSPSPVAGVLVVGGHDV
ncbi:hypothetical protein BC567DRAFT_228049 [Phyllosticta citribraziliensis]